MWKIWTKSSPKRMTLLSCPRDSAPCCWLRSSFSCFLFLLLLLLLLVLAFFCSVLVFFVLSLFLFLCLERTQFVTTNIFVVFIVFFWLSSENFTSFFSILLFFSSSGGLVKIKLKLTTLPRSCRVPI